MFLVVDSSVNNVLLQTNIQTLGLPVTFYAEKQLLLSARLSHRNSIRLSVRHTGRSVKNGAS